MSGTSTIEWTEKTWNPTTGCDRISAGCDNCYALTLAKRLKGMGSAKYQTDGDPRTSGPGFGVAVHQEALGEPLRWRKPTVVFVNSMSDLFHARVPAEFVAQVWDVMARTPQHTYQVLTKRPERMLRITRDLPVLPNVWLGTSIEDDTRAGRTAALRATPAAVRFISAEPLLGPLPSLDLAGIDWLIAGGESGPRCRPIEADWVRDLRDRCVAKGTAFFFKQWGGRTPKANGRELDGRKWDQYPAELAPGNTETNPSGGAS
jgi:protein gp37